MTVLVCSKCGHEMDVAGRPPFSTVTCPQCQTPLTVPVMLGSFLLLERMGVGGMGSVYRALDTGLNRFVAIKVMKAALGEDAKLVQSFIREAQAAAALNHPNIVQIYSCGQEKGQPYIVMELVTGGKMSQLFTREKPMAEVKLLKIALDVAAGLSAANAVGLVHGDIKPENILMDHAGTAKIVDFGLAQFVNAQKDRGEIWGTPYYISPERARGNKADHRSDIYSLGATMFHALSGTPPFDGQTPVDVVLARLKQPTPKLDELCPELQPSTTGLIERMMASDPQLRYPTSASLKSDVTTALNDAMAAASARTQPAPRPSNRSSRVIGLIAVSIALALGGMFLLRVREAANQPVTPVRPVAPVNATKEEKAPALEELTATGDVFDPGQQDLLVEAARLSSGPQPADGFERYAAIAASLPDGSLHKRWVILLEVLPAWRSGNRETANKLLDWCAQYPPDKNRIDHAVNMPQMLAGYFSGAVKKDDFHRYAKLQPGWFAAMRDLMEGVNETTLGQVEKARSSLDAFLVRPETDPAWVTAFRPLASRLRAIVRDVDDAGQQIEWHITRGEADRAGVALAAAKARLPDAIERPLEVYAEKIEALARASEERRRANADRAHRVEVQQDLDRVDLALQGVSSLLLRQRDFSRALITIGEPLSNMSTPEGREAAAVVKDQIAALDEMKKFLTRSPRQIKFTRDQGCDLGGDVIDATPLGVRVTLDYRAVTTYRWDEMSLRSFFRLADFYAGQSGLDAGERADALVGLAMYSLLNGAIEPAQRYAGRAVELDASRAASVRRLLPGLL